MTYAEDKAAEAALQARYDRDGTLTLIYDSDEDAWSRRVPIDGPEIRAFLAEAPEVLRGPAWLWRAVLLTAVWVRRRVLQQRHLWLEEVS